MSNIFMTDLAKFSAIFGTSSVPEIQDAVAKIKAAEEAVNTALPPIAVMVANDLLAKVPFGAVLSPLLDPLVKEGATIADHAMFGLLDHAMASFEAPVPQPQPE